MESLITFHLILIVGIVIVIMYFLKAVLGKYLNGTRNKPITKQIILPAIATLIGAILGIYTHPPCIESLIDKITYGAIVGFFATSIYRFVISYIEKQTGIRIGQSSPPPPINK
jgi:hypothetical protein